MELIFDLNAMISVGTTLSVLGLLYFAGKMVLANFVPRKSIAVDEEKSFQSFEDGCVVYRTSDDELPQFTPQSLEKFNGVNNPLYVALLGKVYDVTKSNDFKKEGLFQIYAGKDVTLALAKQTTNPVIDGSTFTPIDLKRLQVWTNIFEKRYACVGVVRSQSML